jgi:hypothetical protein
MMILFSIPETIEPRARTTNPANKQFAARFIVSDDELMNSAIKLNGNKGT